MSILLLQASELQSKIENAGGERLKNQKAKVDKMQSDIDKHSTEINRHRVQIETGEKMIKKLTKGIEDSKKEKELLLQERAKLEATFKEITEKAFAVQENYKKTQQLIDQHNFTKMFSIKRMKSDYESLKKKMDELHAGN